MSRIFIWAHHRVDIVNNPVLMTIYLTIIGNISHNGWSILQTCNEDAGANEQLDWWTAPT